MDAAAREGGFPRRTMWMAAHTRASAITSGESQAVMLELDLEPVAAKASPSTCGGDA